MQTAIARLPASAAAAARTVRRLGVLAVLACVCLAPATALGQLYGRPVAQPFFDFPTWARFSDCRPGPLPWGYDVFPDYGPMDCGGMPPSVACEVPFVAHRPSSWYASADFLPMTMDYGSDMIVARRFVPFKPAVPGFDANGDGDFADPDDILAIPPVPAHYGPTMLTSDDLKPEFDAGGKFTVGHRIFDCYRIEGTYLGNYEWTSSASVQRPGGDISSILGGFPGPVVPGPDPIFDDNTEVFVAHATSMSSAEFNLRYWVSMPPGPFDVSILVGARYMNLDDRFRVHTTNAGGENDALAETENTLWGLQLGIQAACLKTTRFWVDFDLKGGIYNNEASLFYNLDSFDDASDVLGVTGDASRTSFVGDIAIVGHWQMTPTVAFNLGYQAIFVNGVALGLDNIANPPFADGIDDPPTTQFDDSGHLVFHGAIIGLTWIR